MTDEKTEVRHKPRQVGGFQFNLALSVVISLLCVSLFLGNGAVGKDDGGVLKTQPLSKEERFKKFEAYIKGANYTFYEGVSLKRSYSDQERLVCESAMREIKSATLDKFLEPIYVAQGMQDAGVQEILGQCVGALELDKEYYPSKLSWENKEDALAYYYQVPSDMEFFDLSPYLGKGMWAYIGENAAAMCADPENPICSHEAGLRTLGKIFNLGDCKIHYELNGLGSNRLQPHRRSANDGGAAMYLTDNFYALIRVENNIYQVAYRDNARAGNCIEGRDDGRVCSSSKGNPTIFITKLAEAKNDVVLCVYR